MPFLAQSLTRPKVIDKTETLFAPVLSIVKLQKNALFLTYLRELL